MPATKTHEVEETTTPGDREYHLWFPPDKTCLCGYPAKRLAAESVDASPGVGKRLTCAVCADLAQGLGI
jgi:hypothetical protein